MDFVAPVNTPEKPKSLTTKVTKVHESSDHQSCL